MEVDLLEHEEAREDERLDRREPLRAVDGQRRSSLRADLGEPQAAEEPLEVVVAVAYARRVCVAEEVVAAVDVEGAADGFGQVR